MYKRQVTTETERVPERLTYQSLVIDITKKQVSIDDEEVPLTKKEFEILLLLVQNKGRVFSREDILARIWSDEVLSLIHICSGTIISSPGFRQERKEKSTASEPPDVMIISSAVRLILNFA